MNMNNKLILEKISGKIIKKLILERKTDELVLELSRLVIKNFKVGKNIEIKGIQFSRGDEYANFDFICTFTKDDDFDHPFSVEGGGDMETLILDIVYRSQDFPKYMNDLVAEVKETIDHEFEHVEQQNFEDMYTKNYDTFNEDDVDYNFKHLTSNVEVPAYVRGLIKRSKTKKITLSNAMDEWFNENINKFNDPDTEWPIIKKIWLDFAKDKRSKGQIKMFK